MTITLEGRAAAAEARRSGAAALPDGLSFAHQARRQAFAGQIRSKRVQVADKEFVELDGYATVFDTPYTMWDFFGEYDEVVVSSACDVTLAKKPDVAYLLNHTGMTMARTVSKTLDLSADETGLRSKATVNPQRTDVRDLVIAVDDEAITEMSFAFRILSGRWSEDFTTYYITEVDLDRGDVSAVNFGANPFTSLNARAQQAFDAIEHLAGAPLKAAIERGQARLAAISPEVVAESEVIEEPKKRGRSVATLRALMELEN